MANKLASPITRLNTDEHFFMGLLKNMIYPSGTLVELSEAIVKNIRVIPIDRLISVQRII